MRGVIMANETVIRYHKPNIGALPKEIGKDILMAIMNTPKPDYEKRKKEAEELEDSIFATEYDGNA
jgi:hypothetical protein